MIGYHIVANAFEPITTYKYRAYYVQSDPEPVRSSFTLCHFSWRCSQLPSAVSVICCSTVDCFAVAKLECACDMHCFHNTYSLFYAILQAVLQIKRTDIKLQSEFGGEPSKNKSKEAHGHYRKKLMSTNKGHEQVEPNNRLFGIQEGKAPSHGQDTTWRFGLEILVPIVDSLFVIVNLMNCQAPFGVDSSRNRKKSDWLPYFFLPLVTNQVVPFGANILFCSNSIFSVLLVGSRSISAERREHLR